MNKEDTAIHSLAGGIAGTTAAIATCPLEVIKTRLQASGAPSSSSGSSVSRVSSVKASSSSSSSASEFSSVSNLTRKNVPKLDASVVAQQKQQQQHARYQNVGAAAAGNGRQQQLVANYAKQTPLSAQRNVIIHHQRMALPPPSSGCHGNGQASSFNLSALRHISVNNPAFSGRIKNNNDKTAMTPKQWKRLSLYQQIKYVIKSEGIFSLWRGVGPTLVGVAPSRAIYFSAYSNAKAYCNQILVPDTPIVHCCSAFSAGFFQTTCTNPLWMIRTRLQLDRLTGEEKLTIPKCIQRVYRENGLKGFYRGVTASYFGVSETIIYFVIYEHLKQVFVMQADGGDKRGINHFLQLMLCAGASRMVASSMTYPHEVARTRLREEGNKYRRFWQTLATVWREESYRGLYNGIGTNLLRTIPNTAITMGVYELVVYLFKGDLAI